MPSGGTPLQLAMIIKYDYMHCPIICIMCMSLVNIWDRFDKNCGICLRDVGVGGVGGGGGPRGIASARTCSS